MPPCLCLTITGLAVAGMAARRAIGRQELEERKQAQAAPTTVGEAAVVGADAASKAAMPAGWKPSRFFKAWKKEVDRTAGADLFWEYMGYSGRITPNIRRDAIDSILRTTITPTYRSGDFYEGVYASHNDYDAMRAYAAAFLDAFWDILWAGRRPSRPAAACGGDGRSEPASRRA